MIAEVRIRKSGPKAAARLACRCTNRPFSRILKLKSEWRGVSREFAKIYSGTGAGLFQNSASSKS
jgi:hypothetical protein